MYLFRLRKIEQIDFILSAESADRKKKKFTSGPQVVCINALKNYSQEFCFRYGIKFHFKFHLLTRVHIFLGGEMKDKTDE